MRTQNDARHVRNIVIKLQFKIALHNYQFIDKRFNYRIIVP